MASVLRYSVDVARRPSKHYDDGEEGTGQRRLTFAHSVLDYRQYFLTTRDRRADSKSQ